MNISFSLRNRGSEKERVAEEMPISEVRKCSRMLDQIAPLCGGYMLVLLILIPYGGGNFAEQFICVSTFSSNLNSEDLYYGCMCDMLYWLEKRQAYCLLLQCVRLNPFAISF